MTSNNTSNGEAKLYGLRTIIVIQVVVLSYLLIDNFLVTDEPENTIILVVSGITIPIIVGLYLRSNTARLAMVSFACISIASISIDLVMKLIVLRSAMTGELLVVLLKSAMIPLGFTVWIVAYLTRQDVRRHFAAVKTDI